MDQVSGRSAFLPCPGQFESRSDQEEIWASSIRKVIFAEATNVWQCRICRSRRPYERKTDSEDDRPSDAAHVLRITGTLEIVKIRRTGGVLAG